MKKYLLPLYTVISILADDNATVTATMPQQFAPIAEIVGNMIFSALPVIAFSLMAVAALVYFFKKFIEK